MPSPSSVFSFVRRFFIALFAVVVVTGVAVVSGNAYGKSKFQHESHTVHIDDTLLQKVKPTEPANYLLIGSDIRPKDETPAEAAKYGTSADAGGQRSDVMMVLHVDPVAHTGMLVSFPRDLVVPIPGHGRNLLNAAYSFGGPALVIQTLETYFQPLHINHYLQVDFRSFREIVNTIGHVHIWFPTPVHDPYTQLDVNQAGCVNLNGDQALAYARSRHYNIPRDLQNPAPWNPSSTTHRSQGWIEDPLADLDRIPRQQYFLRTISQAAIDKSGANPTAIFSLISNAFKYLTHDQNLTYDDVKSLAVTFRGFNPAKVQMSTLPIAPSPYREFAAQVVAKFPDAWGVTNLLANFTAPKPQVVHPLVADKVKVRVVNGSGVKGAAAKVLDTFLAAGFRSAGDAADADRSDYQKTQVRYAPGKFREGYTVATAVGTANLVEAASAKNTLGGDALVIVGQDYDSLKHHFDLIPRPAGSVPASTAAVSSTSTSVAPASTTTTTVAKPTTDYRFVPVDPKTGGPLVGCPAR